MNYIFVKIFLQIGERTAKSSHVFETEDSNLEKAAENFTRDFYGTEYVEDISNSKVYFAKDYSLAARLHKWSPITKEEYDLLSKYIY